MTGKRLRELRRALQLNQTAMAELLGLKDKASISMLERGRRPIRGSRLKLLERILAEQQGS